MDIATLFTAALGVGAPWVVREVTFEESKGQLDILMDFAPGSRFPCPKCSTACAVHDRRDHTWRHLNFFQHKTYVHAGQPRVRCAEHGVLTSPVPWGRPGSGFTLLFESMVVLMVQSGMAVRPVARLMGEHDTRLWRVLDHYVQRAREHDDQSEVRAVAVDETSRTKGHEYVTVFSDAHDGRVLFVTEGKGASTITSFFRDFRVHGGEPDAVTDVVSDMSAAFIKGLTEQFPNAIQTVDPFHVMALANKAVDEVRRAEQKEVEGLKKTRWLWLRNEENQTPSQLVAFDVLRDSTLKTARAWRIKTALQGIYRYGTAHSAEQLFDSWYQWAARSRLRPVVRLAKTLRKHRRGVLAALQSRLSNGRAEAINGLIQATKRSARGFRSARNLKTIIYLRLARLHIALPSPLPAN